MGGPILSAEVVRRFLDAATEHGNPSAVARAFGISDRHARALWKKHQAGRDVFAGRVKDASVEIASKGPPDPDLFGRLILPDLPDCVMVLPDLQFPYAHPDWHAFLKAARDKYRPTMIIGIGDEVDSYCLSSYDHDPETMQPSYEYGRALEDMARLYELFPVCMALHSNHGRGRLEKARIRGGFLRSQVLDYRQFVRAPKGWQWYNEIRLGDVLFHHGDGEKKLTRTFLERDIPDQYGRHYSVVHGHRHESAGRQAEISVGNSDYWAAYVGSCINPHAGPFSYTRPRKAKLGCAVIIHGEFKRVRLVQTEAGRWTGAL